MHVILPALEKYTPAGLREGTASTAITRNRTLIDCGAAIVAAGGTFSHAKHYSEIITDEGLFIRSRLAELGPRSQSHKIQSIGTVVPITPTEP